MSEETPNFNIDPDGGTTAPGQFTYKDHQVEIVPPVCCSAPCEWRLTGQKN
jgi:hypothetical protein